MVDTRIATFPDDWEALRGIRLAVFVDEQRVPEDVEMDDRDVECVHLVAVDDDGTPMGTVRIDLAHDGKIGRLAVLVARRRAGIGTALMEHAHEVARARGLDAVWCEAQAAAVPFYERLGYRSEGNTFVRVGIDHVRMRCWLGPPRCGP